ncbi:hypothetical protein [Wolbachia endosymbiont of Psylliodes chrysocephala]|nr:hypothetical protein [Wolbachia endosymbiont of Psylliodes chrysocephala]
MLTSKLFWIPVSGHWDDKEIGAGMTRKEHCHYRVNQCWLLG